MAGDYTRWYRVGTAAVGNGSTSVVGTNTYWLTAGLNPGDIFSLDGVNDYEIFAITDNTHLTLKTAYTGATASGATYHIIRNFTAHVPSQLAAQLSELYGDLARYWDQDTQTIHGKSAYEIACANGYVGTEAQWVEYLRNGGGYTDLVKLTAPLVQITNTNQGLSLRNCLLRGKYHGTITVSKLAEWVAAIRAGTYGDLYLGDTFNISGIDGLGFTVWGFNEFKPTVGASGDWDTRYPAHVVISVGVPSIRGYVNPVHWNGNGILGCNGYTKALEYIAEIEGVIGADKLLTLDNFPVGDTTENGKYTHYTTMSTKAVIPSFIMVNGDHSYGTAYPSMQHKLSFFNHAHNMLYWHKNSDVPGYSFTNLTGQPSSPGVTEHWFLIALG